MNIEINHLDTDITLLYKYAHAYGVPTRFVRIIVPPQNFDENFIPPSIDILKSYQYINITDELPILLKDRKNLKEIKDNYKLSIEDIEGIYYQHYLSKRITREELLENINQLLETNVTLADLESLYIAWISEINETLTKEYNTLTQILNNFNIINSIELKVNDQSLIISKMSFTVQIKLAHPQIKNYDGTLMDFEQKYAIDVFNSSRVSYRLPFIQYNDDYTSYYKIYEGEVSKDSPDYSMIIPSSNQNKEKNHMYFTVFADFGNAEKAKKDSYAHVAYNLKKNEMTIKAPLNEMNKEKVHDLIAANIEEVIPLKIVYSDESRVKSRFYIYNMSIEELSLVFVTMIDLVFSSYLYINETITAYPFKKRLYFHLKSTNMDNEKSIARFSLRQLRTEGYVGVETDNNEIVRINPNVDYVEVLIRSPSRTIAKQLQYLLPRLLVYYQQVKPVFINILQIISPGIGNYIGLSEENTIKATSKPKKIADSNIAQMRELAPDLIIKEYARRCMCNRQPIIIPHEDIHKYMNQKVILNGIAYPRQILPFPPDDPKWYFICPKEEWPFPGLRTNNLENSAKYPFIPCCFKKNEMDPKANSWYNQVYRGIPKKTTSNNARATHVFKKDKLLGPGRTGMVSVTINDLLKLYTPNQVEFFRVGIIYSANSLLHCIFDAFKDENYIRLLSPEDKENYVIRVRKMVAEQVKEYPALLKQELYDFNDDEIYQIINNENIFLDPSMVYHVFEVLFDINIFVFNAPQNADQFSKLEIPRHKYFHAHPQRLRKPTLIIFKYWGTEVDRLTYPQCEYIAEKTIPDTGSIKTLFGDDMYKLLHKTMMNTYESITWSIDPRNFSPVARKNIFYSFNIFEIFADQMIVGQYIDTYGKCRGILIEYEGSQIAIFCPPTQPEKYKQMSQKLTNLPNVEKVLKLINTHPSMITVDDGMLTGLWYPLLDIETGIYIEINPISLNTAPEIVKSLSIGPKHNLFSEGIDEVQRIKSLKRARLIILQLVQWLYMISGLNAHQFIEKYIRVSSKKYEGVDSSKIYDFSHFSRILPEYTDINQAINYLSKTTSLIEDGYIVGYNEKFTDGLKYFIEDFEKNSDGLILEIPTELSGLYQDEYDFIHYENTVIFLSESEMRAWLYSINHLGVKSTTIKKKITKHDAIIEEPYLYIDSNENIYMIQNVVDGNFFNAIKVATEWFYNKKNIGFNVQSEKMDTLPPYIVYGLSIDQTLSLVHDRTNGNKDYIEILSYNTQNKQITEIEQRYAAVLPML